MTCPLTHVSSKCASSCGGACWVSTLVSRSARCVKAADMGLVQFLDRSILQFPFSEIQMTLRGTGETHHIVHAQIT